MWRRCRYRRVEISFGSDASIAATSRSPDQFWIFVIKYAIGKLETRKIAHEIRGIDNAHSHSSIYPLKNYIQSMTPMLNLRVSLRSAFASTSRATFSNSSLISAKPTSSPPAVPTPSAPANAEISSLSSSK
jgi:hypothetical protein